MIIKALQTHTHTHSRTAGQTNRQTDRQTKPSIRMLIAVRNRMAVRQFYLNNYDYYIRKTASLFSDSLRTTHSKRFTNNQLVHRITPLLIETQYTLEEFYVSIVQYDWAGNRHVMFRNLGTTYSIGNTVWQGLVTNWLASSLIGGEKYLYKLHTWFRLRTANTQGSHMISKTIVNIVEFGRSLELAGIMIAYWSFHRTHSV